VPLLHFVGAISCFDVTGLLLTCCKIYKKLRGMILAFEFAPNEPRGLSDKKILNFGENNVSNGFKPDQRERS